MSIQNVALNSLLPAAIPEPRGNPAAHQEAAAVALFTARDPSQQSLLLTQQAAGSATWPCHSFPPGSQEAVSGKVSQNLDQLKMSL